MTSAQRREVEQWIARFEQSWLAGTRPAIEAHLPADPDLRLVVLSELAHVDLELRRKCGELIDPETYFRRFPELKTDDSLIESLRAACADRAVQELVQPTSDMSTIFGRALDSSPDHPGIRLGVGAKGGLANPAPLRIEDYEFISEIARGGMGVVYKAKHKTLGRLAAIKLMRSGEFADKEEMRRFLAEAEAAAQLDHSGIVSVYEAGAQGGQHFIAMAFVDGQSLWQRVREQPFEQHEAARLMQQVAEAVQYAHEQGIIHRDLKPQNIMLTADLKPKVTDFGLAKKTSADSSLTATGQVLGTPSYMPPEQALGGASKVGPLADVYSLGATLYCLLIGRPPFQAASPLETLKQVLECEPVSPRMLNPTINRDLETICLKALAKEAEGRYPSAAEFAQDLGRFLAGEPISGRRQSVASRVWRKIRRNPYTSTFVALTILACLGVAFAANSYQRLRRLREFDRQASDAVEAFDGTTDRWQSASASINELDQHAPEAAAALRDSLERKYLRLIEDRLKLPNLSEEDRLWINSSLELLKPRQGAEVSRLLPGIAARFREPQVAFAVNAPFSTVFEVFTPEDVKVDGNALVRVQNGTVPTKAVSPDVLTRIPDSGNVELEAVFDSSWKDCSELGMILHANRGNATAVQAIGDDFYIGSSDGSVLVRSAASGEPRFTLPRSAAEITCLAPDPVSMKLLVGDLSGQVTIYDLLTRKSVGSFQTVAFPAAMAFSGDGRRLGCSSTGANGVYSIQVWDPGTRKVVFETSCAQRINGLSFSPDMKLLAGACNDSQVRVWSLDSPQKPPRIFLPKQSGLVQAVAFSPDGHRLAAGLANGNVVAWRLDNGERIAELQGYAAGIHDLAFFSDSRQIIAGYDSQSAIVWDLETLTSRARLTGHGGQVSRLAFTKAGTRGLTLDSQGTARLWDLSTQRQLAKFEPLGDRYLIKAPATSENTRKGREENVKLLILHGNAKLRESEQPLTQGPLKLTARRKGSVLSLSMNDQLHPVVFQLVEPAINPGVFGLVWPPSARLLSITARVVPPGADSALENGDRLYINGAFREALDAYQEQARLAGHDERDELSRREAQFKTGLCQLRLGEIEKARSLFGSLAHEKQLADEPWPLAAAFKWWQLSLERRSYADAEAARELLRNGHTDDEIARVVSDDDQRRLIATVDQSRKSRSLLFVNQESIDSLKRIAQIAATLGFKPEEQLSIWQQLFQAEFLAGHIEDAEQISTTEIHTLLKRLPDLQVAAATDIVTARSWLLRLRGKYTESLAEISEWQQRLQDAAPDDPLAAIKLLQETARIHAAQQRWDDVQQDIESIAQRAGKNPDYRFTLQIALMRGALLESRGNSQAATAEWRRGAYAHWLRENPNFRPAPGRETTPFDSNAWIPQVQNLALTSIAEENTTAMTQALMRDLMAVFGDVGGPARLIEMLKVRSNLLSDMWRTPRGRKCLQNLAWQNVGYGEYVRIPGYLMASETIRQGAFPQGITPDEEQLVWDVVSAGITRYLTRELTSIQGIGLASTWQGSTTSWKFLAMGLPKDLRGPCAYVFGRRYQHGRRNLPVARSFFEEASQSAPADSTLKKLSEAALKSIK